MKIFFRLITISFIGISACSNTVQSSTEKEISLAAVDSIPSRNQQIIDTIIKYVPIISPTYKRAVCTELVIPIVEKFYTLSKADKNRIRIITDKNIQELLKQDSPIPKGVYYALTEKGIGEPVENLQNVLPGDLVQFWTDTWGHCGVVKSIDTENMTMELYSSFPSTDGYGIQKFRIPKHCFFVRMK
ncbi:hypothetical protein [Prevotella sp. 10(H)]|uniref:hypothetical protein n=1 Tax=Prevotella sp. 10(H) TaxID=1158294 RepID=UPI0012DBD2D9|nr:hypothetical protein [Prevotella sp. 10(H)]